MPVKQTIPNETRNKSMVFLISISFLKNFIVAKKRKEYDNQVNMPSLRRKLPKKAKRKFNANIELIIIRIKNSRIYRFDLKISSSIWLFLKTSFNQKKSKTKQNKYSKKDLGIVV